MKNRISIYSCLALILALALPWAATAQDEDASPGSLADVWMLVPKAGHAAEFEAAAREHMAARKAGGDPRDWQAYTVVLGEDLTPYVFRHCCFEWADQDGYLAWSAGAGAGVAEHFNTTVAPHVDSFQHWFDVIDWDNSHWPADSGPFTYFGLTTWGLKIGQDAARAQALSKMAGTAKEHGWGGNWLFMGRAGGGSELTVVVPYTSFADMAPPDPTFFEFVSEHLGAEEAASTFQAFGSTFTDAEFTVWRHRPDLSTPEDEE